MRKQKPKVEYETLFGQKYQCDAPGCEKIITHWAQPKGYSGPIYCRRHAHLAVKR